MCFKLGVELTTCRIIVRMLDRDLRKVGKNPRNCKRIMYHVIMHVSLGGHLNSPYAIPCSSFAPNYRVYHNLPFGEQTKPQSLYTTCPSPVTPTLEELFSECLDSLPSRLCDARSLLRLLRWPSLDLSFSLVLSLSLSLGLSRSGRSRSRSLSRGLSWRVSRDSRCSRRSRSLSRGFSRSLLSRFL